MNSTTQTPFTPAQWQELEHQALIFKYLMAGIPVPPDLLAPLRKGLDSMTSRFFHHASSKYPAKPYSKKCVELNPDWAIGCCSGVLLVREEAGSGAGTVPEDGRQEMAMLEGRLPWFQVLRAPHAPRSEPFKKACGSASARSFTLFFIVSFLHRDVTSRWRGFCGSQPEPDPDRSRSQVAWTKDPGVLMISPPDDGIWMPTSGSSIFWG